MAADETVQEYYDMSRKFLQAALDNLEHELHEPALANGIHALELGLKAALCRVIKEPIKTHNVGGLFSKHFRDRVGDEDCSRVNLILTGYNLPRYPGQKKIESKDVVEEIGFIRDFIENTIPGLTE